MSADGAVAKILSSIPAGLVRRASDPVEKPTGPESGIDVLDRMLGGGWKKGSLNILETAGGASTGRTTAAYATVAAATRKGYPAAWIDGDGSLDPVTLAESGADLKMVLWVRGPMTSDRTMKAAHETVVSGLFEIVVVRPSCEWSPGGGNSVGPMQWRRLSLETEKSGSTVLVLARYAYGLPGGCGVVFEGMDPRWLGSWGQPGCLDGTTVRFRDAAKDHDDDRNSFFSRIGYGGFL